MIVVTGSARTGTSLTMRILKKIGVEVPAPQFDPRLEPVREYNPQGFFEAPNQQISGIQSYEFKGKAVKLFGYALSITPKQYVSKVIVCTRDRTEAVKSSVPMYDILFNRLYGQNDAKGYEYVYYDEHYKHIKKYVADMDYMELKLEHTKYNPRREIGRIAEFLDIDLNQLVLDDLVRTIHKN